MYEPPFLAATDFTLSSEKRQRGNSPSQFSILELGGTSMPPMRAVVATVRNLLKGVTLTRGLMRDIRLGGGYDIFDPTIFP